MSGQVRDGSAPAGDPLLGFVVVGALAAVVLAVCVVRLVPPHLRLVVAGRRGRNRVRGPGLVAVWPPAARCVEVSVLPRELTVDVLAAVTADGVRITATATVTCRAAELDLFAGSPGAPSGSAWAAVDAAVEAIVRRYVAAHDLAELATATDPVLPVEPVVEQFSRWGIEVGPVVLRGAAVAVDGQLVRWAATAAPVDDERT